MLNIVDVDDTELEVNLDRYGNAVKQYERKTALIDAGTLLYTTMIQVTTEQQALPEEFYTSEEWRGIYNNPTYDADSGRYYTFDKEFFLESLQSRLDVILQDVGTDFYEAWIDGDTKNSFRAVINPNYKISRKSQPYTELAKQLAVEHLGFKQTNFVEADDVVVYLKKKHPVKYILCAIDKDVLYSVEGKHYNYYTNTSFDVKARWVKVTKEDTIKWLYAQTIKGDSTDDIQGIYRYGVKKIASYFSKSPEDLKELELTKLQQALPYMTSYGYEDYAKRTLELFKANGLTKEDYLKALRQVDCNSLVDLDTETVVLREGRKFTLEKPLGNTKEVEISKSNKTYRINSKVYRLSYEKRVVIENVKYYAVSTDYISYDDGELRLKITYKEALWRS